MNGSRTTPADALSVLLRGELAAAETYDRAIAGFEGDGIATDLNRLRDAHRRAAATLRERAVGTPVDAAGAWGEFGTAVTEAAERVGPATALAALKQGEEHGVNEYEAALGDPALDPAVKDLIRSELLPASRAHVTDLDRLLAGAG